MTLLTGIEWILAIVLNAGRVSVTELSDVGERVKAPYRETAAACAAAYLGLQQTLSGFRT